MRSEYGRSARPFFLTPDGCKNPALQTANDPYAPQSTPLVATSGNAVVPFAWARTGVIVFRKRILAEFGDVGRVGVHADKGRRPPLTDRARFRRSAHSALHLGQREIDPWPCTWGRR
jgi:hypothetical protein